MLYPLSATKLLEYHRCPQAYYFKYERGLKANAFFKSPLLGKALHAALARIYGEWNYTEPLPNLDWIHFCWQRVNNELTPDLSAQGLEILEAYYYQYIAILPALRKPLAVEGKIQARLNLCNIEFKISGRYDRLDWLDDGLELIDYKTSRKIPQFEPDEIDLQLGLYYLALEQRYKKSLVQMSLLYIQLGEPITFEASPEHKQQAELTIGGLAAQLRTDSEWEPIPGHHCDRCSYTPYCPAMTASPEPLPKSAKDQRPLQLTLGLD
jgi:putative RecB family exonuclease